MGIYLPYSLWVGSHTLCFSPGWWDKKCLNAALPLKRPKMDWKDIIKNSVELEVVTNGYRMMES